MMTDNIYTNGKITLIRGDITAMDTDAIVNPSNTSLVLGGGISGAIRSKGGEEIQAEMDKLGGCPVGEAKATGGGRLKARYVIHAVGPQMGEGDEDTKLKSATVESLNRAAELGLDSIALPAISTGIFGYPMDRCAKVMTRAVKDWLDTHKTGNVKKVVFCVWDDNAYSTFRREIDKL